MDKLKYTIIVTYNGSEWIERCLNSVIKSSQVVVIDNGSTDNTIDIIKNSFSDVQLVESKINLGFGAANNLGIQNALDNGAEFIFLLNQDAWFAKGTIEKLVVKSENNPEFGILSPIHLNGEGSMLDRSFGNYLYNKGGRKFITACILNKNFDEIVEIDFVNAAAWLLTKKCVEKVGLFDSIFYHYGEDNNYIQRVIYHEFKVGVVNQTWVFHDREGIVKTNHIKNFNTELRQLTSRWANVLTDESVIKKSIQKTIKQKKRVAIKSLVKGQYKAYKSLRDQINIIEKLGDNCLKSRLKNKKKWKTGLDE